jgi:uncharacterized protein YecT (DUF1311 family)
MPVVMRTVALRALAALATLAASSALAPAATAASRPGTAHTRRSAHGPPVITEKFKPVLACEPSTTQGMEGCAEHKVLRDDAQLNADVRVVFRLLHGAAARRALVGAQRAWLIFRRADCASQSLVYQGGTEQPEAFAMCLAEVDTLRRSELQGFYAALTRGQAGVARFP